ncbi:hypothetical protein LPJ72_000129 [Coemansia sp. Benny D160-2]|nr:hypothetical protein LPJ72_000129 [Coemansia sp. Benny D160-2]
MASNSLGLWACRRLPLLRLSSKPSDTISTGCAGEARRIATTATDRPERKPSTVHRTTVEALKDAVNVRGAEELSNRKLFERLQPDEKTMEMLDMHRLGMEKEGRFVRRRWFGYQEPEVSLPRLAFFAGAQSSKSFPSASLPEIGFVGRSNVGKSTLVNQVCGSAAARISDRPGLTQQINFYTARDDFHLVDMPGYGFAFAKEEERVGWQSLIEDYIRNRKTLRRVMVLLDARHGIKANDRDFMDLMDRTRTKYQFVLTKCDLVRRTDLAKRHLLVSQEAASSKHCIPRVMLVSARDGAGLNLLRKEIAHTCSLGQKYLGSYSRKESIARAEYDSQLKIYKETSRSKKRRR